MDALALPVAVLLRIGVLFRLLAQLAVVVSDSGGEQDFGTIEYINYCCICAIPAHNLHGFVPVRVVAPTVYGQVPILLLLLLMLLNDLTKIDFGHSRCMATDFNGCLVNLSR